jgi:hypothetical protein
VDLSFKFVVWYFPNIVFLEQVWQFCIHVASGTASSVQWAKVLNLLLYVSKKNHAFETSMTFVYDCNNKRAVPGTVGLRQQYMV